MEKPRVKDSWLSDLMGAEYAKSWRGELFQALEDLFLVNSRPRWRGFLKELWRFTEAKEFAKESVNSFAITIGIYGGGRNLIQFLQKNPEQFLIEIVNAVKLIKIKYPDRS
jgi:hypothetical protein